MNLQSKILKYLNRQPATFAFKTEVCNIRGVPDIIVCRNGRYIVIEVKEGADRVSPIQKEILKQIMIAEGQSLVVRDYDVFVKEWEM